MRNAHRLHVASKRRREVFREKFILIAAAVLIALCISVMIGTRLVKAEDENLAPAPARYYRSIEISLGDTLWDIAEEYKEGTGMETAEYVRELMEMNGLDSDRIHEGQYLTVAYYI